MSSADHHHAAVGREPAGGLPFTTKAAFWTGLFALYCVLIPRFGPIGFVLGVLSLVLTPFGYLRARFADRATGLALAGAACALVAVAIWWVAREEWPHVIGGDDNWPSWILPDEGTPAPAEGGETTAEG